MDVFVAAESIETNTINRVSYQLNQIESSHQLEQNPASSVFHVWRSPRGQTSFYQDEQFEILLDGYIYGTGTSKTIEFLPVLARRIIEKKQVLHGSETGIFNLIIFERKSGNFTLANDQSGLLPLYYGIIDQKFFVVSHQYLFAGTFHLRPDYLGLLEKILYGHSIGARTYFEALRRLSPAEIVTFSRSSGNISSTYSRPYFTEYREPSRDLVENLHDALISPFKNLAHHYNSIGIMLSEGFDSRLTTGLAKEAGMEVFTFSHGSKWTRGLRITEEVGKALPSVHQIDGLERGYHSSAASLRKMLLLADNLNVPCFEYGSDYFSQKNIDITALGTALDSTLGANMFFLPKQNKRRAVLQRYTELIKQDLGLLSTQYVEDLAKILLDELSSPDARRIEQRIHNQFHPDVAEEIVKNIPLLAEDIRSELDRIEQTGSRQPSQKFQRYFLENLAGKMWFGQDLVIRMNNRLVVPVYEREFMELNSSLHPKYKFNHKIYIELLRKKFPELARINNGAYLLPAGYPRLVLETSRFWHVYQDEKIIKEYFKTQGRSSYSGYRGARFTDQILRHPATQAFFYELVHNNKSILNENALIKSLDKIRDFQGRVFLFDDYYRAIETCQVINSKF